jgi:multiple sugar transport system permease protein
MRSGRSLIGVLTPALGILVLLRVVPLLYTFVLSFTDWSLAQSGGAAFIGTQNYVRLLQNPDFWQSLKVTTYFTVSATALELVCGLAIALALNHVRSGANAALTTITVPMLGTPVVVGALWRILYNADIGILNQLLAGLGLAKIPWLGSTSVSLISIVLVDMWQWTSFMTLVLYAGLISLPAEPYEAAGLDGASWLQQQRFITLPLLSQLMAIAVVLRAMDAFRTFDIVYVLTAGGPANSTYLISLYIYDWAFKFLKLGMAGALSTVLLAFMAAVAVGVLRMGRRAV